MWQSKSYMNMLEHRIGAMTREGPHEASRQEIAEVLVALAIRNLQSPTGDVRQVADDCHSLVDKVTATIQDWSVVPT